MIESLQPPGWAKPKGYANGMAAKGRLVFVAGQIGWNPETGQFETDDFAEQTAQALRNVLSVLAAAGMGPRNLVKVTTFLINRADLPTARTVRERMLHGAEPASTLLFVAGLAIWELLIRILEVRAFILPAPSAIGAALVEGETIAEHARLAEMLLELELEFDPGQLAVVDHEQTRAILLRLRQFGDVIAQQLLELRAEGGVAPGVEIRAFELLHRCDQRLRDETAAVGAKVSARVGIAAPEPGAGRGASPAGNLADQ